MSTKCTIAHSPEYHLYEDMIGNVVRLALYHAPFTATRGLLAVELPPAVLDAIAAAHARKAFPHQRQEEPSHDLHPR